ncbi:MepB family protein [Pseudoxanthomonas sp. UTMC 1351]|uniref:MepB family protein n=1 Tax=Pseudoxanthomonas sp. UTMC 1351 TaxID=2695853 RepID=UPI0034CD1FA1
MKLTGDPWREAEGADYSALRFELDGRLIVYRVAKTTSKKTGQFVTVWKRPAPDGPIAPLDADDGVDFVVVSAFCPNHCGQFVFSSVLLVSHGVMSRQAQGGKRALRVYPPWSQPASKQAVNTQRWQCRHFLPMAVDGTAKPADVRRLFKL